MSQMDDSSGMSHHRTSSEAPERVEGVQESRVPKVATQPDDGSDEASPLLDPQRISDGDTPSTSFSSPPSSDTAWTQHEGGEPETRSTLYLILLTTSIGGLQLAWAAELSNGSPYLLSLGISKSLLALVWIAGPLSGTLVQPYIGIRSDQCRSRLGKRRPFIIGGAAATVLSLLALSWTQEIVGGFMTFFGADRDSDPVKITTITFAVVMIYVLDFSINVIQAAIRAFIVDKAPIHQQDAANAWASRLTGVGSIIGYLFGYADLPKTFWFLGDTQFKVLCAISSVILLITVAMSCLSISERDSRSDFPAAGKRDTLTFFKAIVRSMRTLPPQILRVCQVQFFAWIGWFPFLFYTTTYVAEIYAEHYYAQFPNLTPAEMDAIWEQGTRVGTFALLIFALTTFISSVMLPFFVAKSYKAPERPPTTPMSPAASPDWTSRRSILGQAPSRDNSSSVLKTVRNLTSHFELSLDRLEIRWLTLRRTWMISHIFFAILTWLTFVVRDTAGATVLIAFIGIPWAVTSWAPFALIAAEVSKRDSIRRGLIRAPPTRDGQLLAAGEDPAQGADQAGIVLGIHNVAIAAPQIIATLASSLVFRALQKPRGSVNDDSVAWVLRLGGLAALVAAYMSKFVHEQDEE